MIGWNSTDEESRPHPWLPHRSRFLELVTGHMSLACAAEASSERRLVTFLVQSGKCESMEQAGERRPWLGSGSHFSR